MQQPGLLRSPGALLLLLLLLMVSVRSSNKRAYEQHILRDRIRSDWKKIPREIQVRIDSFKVNADTAVFGSPGISNNSTFV